ncbi:hypothetical protein [Pseudomonas linyingensis]|jgi:hypothetical protein|uniref:hypothetical protein n=1 Tax=Pseudomonas linyingensis TaxID=915471 RepID=UPI0011145F82|nr:hypothetical protein [Pseudomonas linyingensis]
MIQIASSDERIGRPSKNIDLTTKAGQTPPENRFSCTYAYMQAAFNSVWAIDSVFHLHSCLSWRPLQRGLYQGRNTLPVHG